METQKEKCSNQEEGFNPMLLRLGSPIPTISPNDQESPIMFTDSCSMCGSKKRRCLTPSFGQRKKKILIDPTSMKEASSTDEESQSHHSSSPQISPSFFHQIPKPTPQTSPSLRRSVSDLSSFALSGSFSSPKSPENASAIPNQISNPSNAYFGRSRSFSSCFDTLKSTLPETSPFSSPKSPENTAAIANPISSPSNAYLGRSSSFSGCLDPLKSTLPKTPPSSSPFHLPKSSTATPTDSVPKNDEKQIGDQKDPKCASKDCSRGNSNFGVLAATTDHPKHEQFEEGNVKKVQFSCSCGKHYQVQFFG